MKHHPHACDCLMSHRGPRCCDFALGFDRGVASTIAKPSSAEADGLNEAIDKQVEAFLVGRLAFEFRNGEMRFVVLPTKELVFAISCAEIVRAALAVPK